jgi:hypothetical protein
MTLQKTIKDLIFFYVKSNYEKYLKENNITKIHDSEIDNIINKLYDQRKSHIQIFIKDALKQLYENKMDEYPGDQTITNMLLNIFQDDDLCKNRVIIEIKLHQESLINKK